MALCDVGRDCLRRGCDCRGARMSAPGRWKSVVCSERAPPWRRLGGSSVPRCLRGVGRQRRSARARAGIGVLGVRARASARGLRCPPRGAARHVEAKDCPPRCDALDGIFAPGVILPSGAPRSGCALRRVQPGSSSAPPGRRTSSIPTHRHTARHPQYPQGNHDPSLGAGAAGCDRADGR